MTALPAAPSQRHEQTPDQRPEAAEHTGRGQPRGEDHLADQPAGRSENQDQASGPDGYNPKDQTVALSDGEKTIEPFVKGPRTFYPLACDIGNVSVSEAAKAARLLITTMALHPGDPEPLLRTLDAVADWAEAHDHHYLAELVGETAETLIRDISGVDDLTFAAHLHELSISIQQGRYSPTEEAPQPRAHRVRNALIAMRGATVFIRPRRRTQRHLEDTLAFALPELRPLEARRFRALSDEEVMLCRLLVQIDLAEDADPRVVLNCLLALDGLRNVEATALVLKDFDDPTAPTKLHALSAWSEEGVRTLPLSDYAQATIPLCLHRFDDSSERLVYTGRSPGTLAASNSIQPQLDRHLRRVGIPDPYVTPKSMVFARAEHALFHDADYAAALTYHGGVSANLIIDLKLKCDEAGITKGKVRIYRAGDLPVEVCVQGEDFYDDSVTKHGTPRRDYSRTKQRTEGDSAASTAA